MNNYFSNKTTFLGKKKGIIKGLRCAALWIVRVLGVILRRHVRLSRTENKKEEKAEESTSLTRPSVLTLEFMKIKYICMKVKIIWRTGLTPWRI